MEKMADTQTDKPIDKLTENLAENMAADQMLLPAERSSAEQESQLSLIDISYRGVPEKKRKKLHRAKTLREKRHVRRAKLRKKIIKGSAASMLGLSITLAGLFPTAEDLLRQQTIRQLGNNAPVEMMIEEELPGSEEDHRKKTETGTSGRGLWSRLKEGLRNLVLRIPVAIRACVFLPLWAGGYLVIHLLAGLYQVVLAPAISHVISYILCAGVLLGVFVLTMKSIFPDMPLKKILSKKTILWVLIGAAVLKILDILLPVFWGEYTRYKYLIMLLAGFVVLGVILIPRIFRHYRKKEKQDKKNKKKK